MIDSSTRAMGHGQQDREAVHGKKRKVDAGILEGLLDRQNTHTEGGSIIKMAGPCISFENTTYILLYV